MGGVALRNSKLTRRRLGGGTSTGPPGSISTLGMGGIGGMGMLREEDAGGIPVGMRPMTGDRPNSPMLDRWVAEGGGGIGMEGTAIDKNSKKFEGQDEGLEGEDGEPTALALIGDNEDEDEMVGGLGGGGRRTGGISHFLMLMNL